MLYILNKKIREKTVMTSIGALKFDARGIAECENDAYAARLAEVSGYSIVDADGELVDPPKQDDDSEGVKDDARSNEGGGVNDNSGTPENGAPAQQNGSENGTGDDDDKKEENGGAAADDSEGVKEEDKTDGATNENAEDNAENANGAAPQTTEERQAAFEAARDFLSNTANSNAMIKVWAEEHGVPKLKATNRAGMVSEIMSTLFPEFV